MSASPLDELLARIARLETENAEKDKRLRDLGGRVFSVEAQLRDSALDRDRLKAITTQLVLAVWALRRGNDGALTNALSEDAIRACIAAAQWLDIPLAA
jgi:hypothetical protein